MLYWIDTPEKRLIYFVIRDFPTAILFAERVALSQWVYAKLIFQRAGGKRTTCWNNNANQEHAIQQLLKISAILFHSQQMQRKIVEFNSRGKEIWEQLGSIYLLPFSALLSVGNRLEKSARIFLKYHKDPSCPNVFPS